jgi:hypothetical protein
VMIVVSALEWNGIRLLEKMLDQKS